MTLNSQRWSNVFRRNLSFNEAPMFVRGISEQTNFMFCIRMGQSLCACYSSLELLKALVMSISLALSNRKLLDFRLFHRSCFALKGFSNSWSKATPSAYLGIVVLIKFAGPTNCRTWSAVLVQEAAAMLGYDYHQIEFLLQRFSFYTTWFHDNIELPQAFEKLFQDLNIVIESLCKR